MTQRRASDVKKNDGRINRLIRPSFFFTSDARRWVMVKCTCGNSASRKCTSTGGFKCRKCCDGCNHHQSSHIHHRSSNIQHPTQQRKYNKDIANHVKWAVNNSINPRSNKGTKRKQDTVSGNSSKAARKRQRNEEKDLLERFYFGLNNTWISDTDDDLNLTIVNVHRVAADFVKGLGFKKREVFQSLRDRCCELANGI